MKEKFYAIANKHGVEIVHYKTYRSDMGVQVFDISTLDGDRRLEFSDGYFIGSGQAEKDKVVAQYEYELLKKFTFS